MVLKIITKSVGNRTLYATSFYFSVVRDWLVWSDWNRDCGREKAANWARKVAQALFSFSVVNSDPRMYLLFQNKEHRQWLVVDDSVVELGEGDLRLIFTHEGRYKLEKKMRVFPHYGKFMWGPEKKISKWMGKARCKGSALLSPLDIPDPWRFSKYSFKFFQCMVSRSRGIKLPEGTVLP